MIQTYVTTVEAVDGVVGPKGTRKKPFSMTEYSEYEQAEQTAGKLRRGILMHKERWCKVTRETYGYSELDVQKRWDEYLADPAWPRDMFGPTHSPLQLMQIPDSEVQWGDWYKKGKTMCSKARAVKNMSDTEKGKLRHDLLTKHDQLGGEAMSTEEDRWRLVGALSSTDGALSGVGVYAGNMEDLVPEDEPEMEENDDAVMVEDCLLCHPTTHQDEDPDEDVEAKQEKKCKKQKVFDREAAVSVSLASWTQECLKLKMDFKAAASQLRSVLAKPLVKTAPSMQGFKKMAVQKLRAMDIAYINEFRAGGAASGSVEVDPQNGVAPGDQTVSELGSGPPCPKFGDLTTFKKLDEYSSVIKGVQSMAQMKDIKKAGKAMWVGIVDLMKGSKQNHKQLMGALKAEEQLMKRGPHPLPVPVSKSGKLDYCYKVAFDCALGLGAEMASNAANMSQPCVLHNAMQACGWKVLAKILEVRSQTEV
eukprot:3678605-Amphidinium_carterae.1